MRREGIKQKSKGEQVKHPYNNHIWLSLAHFVDESHSLEDIAARQHQRKI